MAEIEELFEPTANELKLAALDQKRVSLCAALASSANRDKRVINANLSAVNVQIKRLNLVVSEQREARVLWLAARHILDDETFQRVLDEARALRMGKANG